MFVELMPLLTGRTVLITVAKVDDKIKSIRLKRQFPEWAFAAQWVTPIMPSRADTSINTHYKRAPFCGRF